MSMIPEDSMPPLVIRVTKEEALSAHVDDLLARRASMRGERGITARRGRKWYFRNWFVFAVAGIVGALVAVAIIEPFFDDLIYARGRVKGIDTTVPRVSQISVGNGQAVTLHASAVAMGSIQLNGETLWLTSFTRQIQSGKVQALDIESIQEGSEIGVYIEYFAEEQITAGLVSYIEQPPTRTSTKPVPLKQLHAEQTAVSLMLFPAVAAFIGLFIGAVDGAICRLWWRMFVGGLIGLLVGFLGGFVSQFVAGLIYMPLTSLAAEQQAGGMGQFTTIGFLTQVTGRGLAWCLAGMAMGLGQGIALRSGRLLLYGFLGGAIGGLIGGLLFDPIDMLMLGAQKPSAHISRLIGMPIIGAGVGIMIGVVELLARDAWLRMVHGPLSGKEFLVFKDVMQIGASPRSDVYLFNDHEVADRHAIIRASADQYDLETVAEHFPVLVNRRAVRRTRLRHGDEITLGSTVFTFQRRRTD